MNNRVIESYPAWKKRCSLDLSALFTDYLADSYTEQERAAISSEGLSSRREQFCQYMYTQCDTRIPT